MHIKITYSPTQSILIKLFDRPAINDWFIKYSSAEIIYQQCWVDQDNNSMLRSTELAQQPNYVSDNWNSIKMTLRSLYDLNFKIPFEIPEDFDYNQKTLNKFHRFFTYNILWHFEKDLVQNPYDPDFTTDLDLSQWHSLLNNMNVAIHSLEFVTPTEHKKILEKYPGNFLWFGSLNRPLETPLIFDKLAYQENYRYFDYDQHPLVLLDGSILGKSVLQSFLDGDDPTCKDCTGRSLSHGGFIIDLNTSRKQIYTSTEFRSWAKSYDLKDMPLEFPIGYVVNPDQLNLVCNLIPQSVVFFN
jgi:hypothetical protein